MAKIENTTVYPLTTPSVDDFIIGTDTSDENRTVSFSIESITATSLLQGLQSVLDTSSIATQNISLTGNITVSGTVYPTTITAQGSTGTAGQLLSSTATGIQWVDVPINPCCTLDDTLTVGNTTTQNILTTGSIAMSGAGHGLSLLNGSIINLGANCSITTDDDIRLNLPTCVLDFNYGASISDGNNSLGTSGQIFTRGPAGVEWVTGIPVASMPTLQEVLTSGNTATGIEMAFTGSSATTFAVGSTIQSFAPNQWQATNTYHASGTALGTAGINLIGSLSDGSTGTGTTDQVLTSTVTGVQWKDVSAVGVSSVTTTTPIDAASSLMPITITPTSGAVLVRQNIYNGGSLIGCVPEGGTNATFLRGDGSWVAPLQAPEWVQAIGVGTTKITMTASNYYMSGTPGAVGVESNTSNWSFDFGASPPSSVGPTDDQHAMSMVYANSSATGCTTSYPNHTLCDAAIMFSTGYSDTFFVTLWKSTLAGHSIYEAVPAATWTEVITAGSLNATQNMTISTSGTEILEPGYGFFATVRATTGNVQGSFAARIVLKFSGSV